MNNTKVCKICKLALPLTEFYSGKSMVNKNNPEGYYPHCKYCQSAKHKKWREAKKQGSWVPRTPLYLGGNCNG